MPHTLSAPLPGRFHNRHNHVLTLERSERPELQRLQPRTKTAEAAHLVASHRFLDRKGRGYDGLIDERAFTLLVRTGIREDLIQTGPHGRPVSADAFLAELAPYERYFEPGPRNPLEAFKRALTFWSARATRYEGDSYLDSLPRHPHDV